MFRITKGKGFGITFENGYTVSVQFGPANYCDHYRRRIGHDEEDCGREGSGSAECAVFGPDGSLVKLPRRFGRNQDVTSHSCPKVVLSLMNWAAKQKAERKEEK